MREGDFQTCLPCVMPTPIIHLYYPSTGNGKLLKKSIEFDFHVYYNSYALIDMMLIFCSFVSSGVF